MTEIRIYPVDNFVRSLDSPSEDVNYLVAIHCAKDSTVRCPRCASESYILNEKFVVNKNNTVIQKGKCGHFDCNANVRMFRKHDLFRINTESLEQMFHNPASHDYTKGKLRSLMGTKSIPTDLLVNMIKIKDYNEHFVLNNDLTLLDFLSSDETDRTTAPDGGTPIPTPRVWPPIQLNPTGEYIQNYQQMQQQYMSPQHRQQMMHQQQQRYGQVDFGSPFAASYGPPFTAQQQTFGDRTGRLVPPIAGVPPRREDPNRRINTRLDLVNGRRCDLLRHSIELEATAGFRNTGSESWDTSNAFECGQCGSTRWYSNNSPTNGVIEGGSLLPMHMLCCTNAECNYSIPRSSAFVLLRDINHSRHMGYFDQLGLTDVCPTLADWDGYTGINVEVDFRDAINEIQANHQGYECHLCRVSRFSPPASISTNHQRNFCEDCYNNIVNGLQY